ncbi:hypothetical protein [Pseudoduganella sp. GCM10020061]|uniref:hypothetical protein n=1 Tax=Pseudoduganella sp. GCM10020061 TaxID=3317345 RepID=UPI00364514B7
MRTIRLLAACIACAGVLPQAMAAPSTFGPVVGSALLCRDDIDNAYFHRYFTLAFGPSYKREGGAYWFRADATLWGSPVREVLVSDGSGDLAFIAAVADATPDELDTAIRKSAGVRHRKMDASRHAVLESAPGSRIVYFQARSKIYCAKSRPPLPGH